MKKQVKIWLTVLVLALGGAGAAFYFMQPKPVTVQSVESGVLAEQVVEQGVLAPERSMTLLAETSGTVLTVNAQAGRAMSEGEELVVLDASKLQNELKSQIAALKLQQSAIYSGSSTTKSELVLRQEQLKQQLTTAQREFDRLFGESGTAESLISIAESNYSQAARAYKNAKEEYGEIDDADRNRYGYTELAMLRDQMAAARESLEMAQNNGSETTRAYYQDLIASCEAQLAALDGNDVHTQNSAYASAQQLQLTIDRLTDKLEGTAVLAPYNGMVREVLVEEGGFVAENEPVAVVYSGESMHVEVMLLTADALALREGDKAVCRFADGSEREAVVRFISPVAEEVVSAIGLKENRSRVELTVSNLPPNVGAGHDAELTFTFVAAQNALTVPAACIVPDGAASAVYVVREGRVVSAPVQTGLRRGGRVEILSGLAAGDSVVLSPYDSSIKAGDRVTVQTAAE